MRTYIVSMALLLSFIAIGGVYLRSIPYEDPQPAPTITYEDLSPAERKQIDCLADNIYFEARSQSLDGQVAVALVTLNRVSSETFPKTICEVVKQRTKQTCQFSWWCNAKLRAQSIQRRFSHDWDTYLNIRDVAVDVFVNYEMIEDITNGALYYHADYVPKRRLGVRNLHQTVQIDQHIFYRNSL